MARHHRKSSLETRTARLKSLPRGKPYAGPSLARGIRQDYRRNKTGNGSWIARGANGHGKYWTKVIAEADDYDESNGKTILNFYEAQEAIKKLVRGEDGSVNAPITVDGALIAYKTDLKARGANPYNADWPRVHLSSLLLSKPVAILDATELKNWRDSLLGTVAKSTINRLCGCVCAALEQAAQHDKRIKNRDSWETGLAGLLQVAIGNMTTRQLGKALRRISSLGDVGGAFLERQGRDKRGALWRVRFPATV